MPDQISKAEPLPPELRKSIREVAGWLQDLRATWIEIDRFGGFVIHAKEDREPA